MKSIQTSAQLAKEARKLILQITNSAKAPHIGSSLSVIDILATLYHDVANICPQEILNPKRDMVILSKGHAASALYSILALTEFISVSELLKYCQNGSLLGGHVTSTPTNGVELSTGSLGHGMPYGLGLALNQKLRNFSRSRTFVVMSDGECNEGTTWESALIAQQFNLNNLVVIIDRNRLQSIGGTEETIALEPLRDKWEAFNWEVRVIDGHNHEEIKSSLEIGAKPICVIANTVKGKGISYMENSNLWHYRSPSSEEVLQALGEIESELS